MPRPIPEIRADMKTIAHILKNSHGLDELAEELLDLCEETKRRPPAWPKAKPIHADPTLVDAAKIREYKRQYPNISHRAMSIVFQTSTRCISLALAGPRT
jgi:hypothetical protein